MCIKRKAKRVAAPWHSTPIWAYTIALVCAVLFVGISVWISCCKCSSCCSWWSAFFLNVGYGTFASIIVTVLVDIGNTKRQQKKDKMAFDRLNADLKELCIDLPSEMYTAVYEVFGYDENSKRPFTQWTNKLFSDKTSDPEKQKREIAYVIQHISSIKKVAAQLKSDLKYLPDNQYIDVGYEQKIKEIIASCTRIKHAANKPDYASCVRNIEELKGAIIELYSELSADYSRDYNEEEYIL